MYLFVSPHFDDAVLSCGGLIATVPQATVLTIMAGHPPTPLPQSPLIQELHERWESGKNPITIRQIEDKAAIHLLGAKASYMSIPDCIYRTHNNKVIYPNGDDDLFGDVHPNDPAKTQLESYDLLDNFLSVQTIVAPLAIGNHVDHQLVRDWILSLHHNKPSVSIWFYEDYPYSENSEKIYATVNDFPVQLESSVQYVDEVIVNQKCKAIAKYQSQLSTFWNGVNDMKNNIHQHMKQTGNGKIRRTILDSQ